jgi:hypothetical protein
MTLLEALHTFNPSPSTTTTSMDLQSIADLRLLNGLLPVISVFDLFFPFVILHLLMSVRTQFTDVCPFTIYWRLSVHNLLMSIRTQFTDVCPYTILPTRVWSSSKSTSLRVIFKYLTYLFFTIHSVNMTNPMQLTYSDKLKYNSLSLSYIKDCAYVNEQAA